MELYLQFGWGMMEHCRHLLSNWGGGTVILSPRDLYEGQLLGFTDSMLKIKDCATLLDPQFFLPHANHKRLCSHEYWPSDYESSAFWQGVGLERLINNLFDINSRLSTSHFILPGLLATKIDADWLNIHSAIFDMAKSLNLNLPLIMTLAISGDATRDNDQVALLIEESEKWDPAGYYIVFEHPRGQYLVDDVSWLLNTLDITATLRLRGHHVILGYCNQQMLIASITKVQAVSSGTWMNVRSFPQNKFKTDDDDDIKQRAIWYYCP